MAKKKLDDEPESAPEVPETPAPEAAPEPEPMTEGMVRMKASGMVAATTVGEDHTKYVPGPDRTALVKREHVDLLQSHGWARVES